MKENSVIDTLLSAVPIPKMIRVRQRFDRPSIDDLQTEFLQRLRGKGVLESVHPGMTIAVGVGSRGITNQPIFVRLLIDELKARGAIAFIVPAMGSHGGATASGQKSMLEEMGFSEDSMGVQIRATMDVVNLGTSENGLPVSIDRFASEADGLFIINRIKPHVSFRGPYESGIMKMIAIGFGKQRGAEICHDLGFGKMAENIPAIGRKFIEKTNIIGAIGLMENAYHETCRIEILKKNEIEKREPALQEEAKRLAPKIHFDELDVLIIDEIGKDISGTGFDTNIAGRYHTPYASGGPDITRIAVLNLTDASHGNANGIGIVDFTTRRVFEKIQFDQTYPNSLTSTVPASVKIPMVLDDDRKAIRAAIRTCNIPDKHQVRLARIRNTISLESIEVSENLSDLVVAHPLMEIEGDSYELAFDERGNL